MENVVWSSVGSAGIANAADLAQLVFSGAQVQFGVTHNDPFGGGQNAPAIPGERLKVIRAAVGFPARSVVLRYPVNLGLGSDVSGFATYRLGITCQVETGCRIVARFVEVEPQIGIEFEPILVFDSAVPSAGQTVVGREVQVVGSRPVQVDHDNVHYVELTLSIPARLAIVTSGSVSVLSLRLLVTEPAGS